MSCYETRMDAADALAQSGRWQEAAEAYAQLVSAGKSEYRLHYNYGTVLMTLSRFHEGRDQLNQALLNCPDSLEAMNNVAGAHLKVGDPCAAEETCRQILALDPHYHYAWSNLGVALTLQGRLTEAVQALQRTLDLQPEDRIARDNLLLMLNNLATDGEELGRAHRLLCANIPAKPRKPLPEIRDRRIRVGYLSNDFKSHSVAYFMAAIVGTHDRNTFEVFCYSTTPSPDWMTKNFVRMAEHFVDLSTCTDVEAAAHIEADRVDLLVDLGGHTEGNRLGIFALRPAPVQATYLGYPATTGCSFIDYRIIDALTDPPGSESHATETLIRLPPPFLCYYPHVNFPPTAPLPALANGYITFGSFNQSPKISEDTLDLWSAVLRVVPSACLLLKSKNFTDTQVQTQFRERFQARGVDGARIDFAGHIMSVQGHLSEYGRIDIALDTFPYNGTTTTCEALWMGVPVVTLVGDLHAARVGYTILSAVGLDGMAAATAEAYVALAGAFAEDLDQLSLLRGRLQRTIGTSSLCDRFRFTKGLEEAYRKMLTSNQ